jgi:hypothetical protein
MTASNLKTGHDRFLIPVSKITPSPENDLLYRPVRLDDRQTIQLADSIREFGVREPIVLTTDNYILSGHRRYAAAKLAGMKKVPVRYENISSDHPDFVKLLREFNRQREKTLDERLREEIVSADQQDTYRELVEHRQQASRIDVETVVLKERRVRPRITEAKELMLNAVLRVLEERRRFWPLSDRSIHYALLNDPPLRHAGKPDSRYTNRIQSYKDLSELVTRARVTGQIPWEAIDDETRPITTWNTFGTAGEFINKEIRTFGRNYWRNLMQSQPNHIELLVEKNTVDSIVREIAERYCIPVSSGRGYSSKPPQLKMKQRLHASGKDKLVLIVASDFDPEGESIPESYARWMRDDFGVTNIECVKAALTYEQTQTLTMPPALPAKESSSRFRDFFTKYGRDVYELEALQPEKLQELIDQAIRSVIDVDLFNREVEREREESQWLDVTRRRLVAAMGQIDIDQEGSR